MEETVKVTQNGYRKLITQKQELFRKLKKTQGKKGEAAENGGDGWHDNFSFEQLCHQEMMDNQRIADISKYISRIELVEDPINDEFLQIGHIVFLEFDDGEEREYEIVGFGGSDLSATPQKIEYLAPIVRKFVNKEVDTTAKVNIGGKVREITLVEILRKEA